jgi:micrococcal nuclease
MRQRPRLSFKIRVALSVVLLLVGGMALLEAANEATEPLPDVRGERASVLRVVDGDTIIVMVRGEEYSVRCIGVDAPETVHPDWPMEPFGLEAAAFNKMLVEGESVRLEWDVSQADQFGRLLRYVRLGDGRMVNAVLLQGGYARATEFPPDVRYGAEFERLEREAKTASGACGL